MGIGMTAPTAADRPELDALGPRVSVTVSPKEPKAGEIVTLTATLTNDTQFPLKRAVLYLLPPGTDPAKAFQLGNVPPGKAITKNRQIQLADDAEGKLTFTAHCVFDVTANSCDAARVSTAVTLPYRSLASTFNNAGISDDAKPDAANIDGSRSSLSAQALATVGCTPGATVTYDGVKFTWPNVKPGQPDNAFASGQTVLLAGTGTRLAFLGTSTWGESKGEGKLLYADGTSQPFAVAVKDWYGASPDAAIVAPYRNTPTGPDNNPVSLFFWAVPVQEGKQLSAVVLPNISDGVWAGGASLHVFAMTLA
jgi:hypothetical protein